MQPTLSVIMIDNLVVGQRVRPPGDALNQPMPFIIGVNSGGETLLVIQGESIAGGGNHAVFIGNETDFTQFMVQHCLHAVFIADHNNFIILVPTASDFGGMVDHFERDVIFGFMIVE